MRRQPTADSTRTHNGVLSDQEIEQRAVFDEKQHMPRARVAPSDGAGRAEGQNKCSGSGTHRMASLRESVTASARARSTIDRPAGDANVASDRASPSVNSRLSSPHTPATRVADP